MRCEGEVMTIAIGSVVTCDHCYIGLLISVADGTAVVRTDRWSTEEHPLASLRAVPRNDAAAFLDWLDHEERQFQSALAYELGNFDD